MIRRREYGDNDCLSLAARETSMKVLWFAVSPSLEYAAELWKNTRIRAKERHSPATITSGLVDIRQSKWNGYLKFLIMSRV